MKNSIASLTVSSSTSWIERPSSFTFRTCGWKRLPSHSGAAHVEVAQELHLDFLEAGAAAALAAAAPGVEGKRARGQALRHRVGQAGEEFADPVVDAEIKNRRRARGARERRLVDHHDLADAMRAGHAFAGAGFLALLEPRAREQVLVEHVVDERDLPEPETPVTQVKTPSGISTSMFLQIVLARAFDLERSRRGLRRFFGTGMDLRPVR